MKKGVFNDSLKTMLTIVMIISLSSIVAIGSYSVINNIEKQTENIENSTISHLKTSSLVFFERLKNIQRFVDILGINEELHTRLDLLNEENLGAVTTTLNTIIHDFSEIEGCVLVNSSGEAFIYNLPALRQENLLRLQVSCPNMSDVKGHLNWYNLEETELDTSIFNQYVFCASNIYYDATVKVYLFVKRDIFKSFFATSPYESIIGIMNENGRLIISNDTKKFMSSYYSNGKNIVETFDTEQGIFQFVKDGEDYVCIHYQSPIDGFKYVEIYKHSTFYRNCYDVIPYILIILILLLCILLFLYGVLHKRFLTPFKKLRYCMENFTDASLNQSIIVDGNSEITMLSDGFNQMLSRINNIIADIKNKEEEKKQAELLALKSQIRPHFIYNTVNSIKILAMNNQQKDIAKALQNLAQLLKMSFSSTETHISLSQDMELIKGYVELMQICYENAIDVTYHIEENVRDCVVPNMIIQPIVENAIRHGLAPKIAEQKNGIKLYIEAKEQEDKMLIKITDSGIGMSEEKIKEVRTGRQNSLSGSVGLRNIVERIRLLYGEEGFLEIESKEGFYTTIQISLPGKGVDLS